MKIKCDYKVGKFLYGKTFLDLPEPKGNLIPGEYLLFVKDTSFDGDMNNKLSLIIIYKNNGYCVNNNFKFNSFEVKGNMISIYIIHNNKRREINYWIKQ